MVWGAFGAAMALACGVLVLGDAQGPRPVLAMAMVSTAGSDAGMAPREATLDRGRWNAIVIHHSGSPAGDSASIARLHGAGGLAGLGYHFVIGNGQGMDDGQVVAGYRWDHQLPGAHAVAGMAMNAGAHGPLDADALNRSAIAVCIVGNTDRRAPTEAQLRALRALIRSLCAEFGIAREHVRFRAELGTTGGAVGEFPLPSFRAGLAP